MVARKQIVNILKEAESGDSLYKIMPVPLDFTKILSRMSKQNEAI
ncbi:MAG: hypothetical protein VB048_07065 [Bacteroidaceae bacterium]|nr:hypothetical protein [Bacteroidaceae bacterium]